jgi:transcriptional regulator with XRE-family HTH domain
MKEVQKDPIRAKRLDEVYKHLFAHFGITSQKHLAEVLKVQRTGLSSAFNGNVANLTDNLFKKICAAFPGVFNLDYLLTGKGDLLTVEENVKSTELEKANRQMPTQPSATGIDSSSIMNAALAAQMQTIESLKSEKDTLLEAHARELQTKDDLIQSLRDQIAANNQLIAEQKARLIDYRRIIDSHNGLPDYPFPIGAAENNRDKSLI